MRNSAKRPRRTTQGKARRLAIVSRKGGPGKTTIATHLARGLALAGRSVALLEIDDRPRAYERMAQVDAQSAPALDDSETTMNLFLHPEEGLGGAYFSIDEGARLMALPFLGKDTVARLIDERGWHAPQELHFLPGTKNLRTLESRFVFEREQAIRQGRRDFSPFERLSEALAAMEDDYDYIIIDTPPSLSLLQTNIILASSVAEASEGSGIIPVVDFDPESVNDYDCVIEFYEECAAVARTLTMPAPRVYGVVYNKFEADVEDNDPVLLEAYTCEHLDPNTGQRVPPLVPYTTLGVIPMDSARMKRASARAVRMSMHTYAPTSLIGKAMWAMVAQVDALGNGRSNAATPARSERSA